MADSFQCMTKPTTIKKIKKKIKCKAKGTVGEANKGRDVEKIITGLKI